MRKALLLLVAFAASLLPLGLWSLDRPEMPCGYVDPPVPAVGVRALAAVSTPALGSRRVLVVNGSAAQMTGDVLPFWSAASYGQVAFEADTISGTFPTPCSLQQTTANMVAALDDQVYWPAYQHAIVYASTAGCGYSGIGMYATLNSADGPIGIGVARYDASASSRTARHEFGHTLQLPHHRSWPCAGVPAGGITSCAGSPAEYGGYDIMGSGLAGVNAIFRERLGWLTPLVPVAGTYSLAPLGASSGLRAIAIPRTGVDALVVEASTSAGVRINTNWTVPWAVGSPPLWQGPIEVDPSPTSQRILYPGETFVDGGTGARVSVLWASTAGATVAIEPGVPDYEPPTGRLISPTSGTVSGIVPLSLDAFDDQLFRVSWKIVQNGSLLLEPTLYAPPFVSSWDSTTGVNGYTPVSSWAWDRAGNQSPLGAASLTVANQSTPTPAPTAIVPPTPTPTPGCWPPRSKRCRG